MLYPKRMLERRHGLSASAPMDELRTVGVITRVCATLRHCTATKRKRQEICGIKYEFGEIAFCSIAFQFCAVPLYALRCPLRGWVLLCTLDYTPLYSVCRLAVHTRITICLVQPIHLFLVYI